MHPKLKAHQYTVFFYEGQIDSDNMLIAYCSTEHMLTDFFNKYLQGALLMKFRKVIMGWKQIYTLHMGLTSTKEHARNMDEVYSSIK